MKKIFIVLTLIFLSSCVQIKEKEKSGKVISLKEIDEKCKYWEVTYLYRNIFEHTITLTVGSQDLYEKLNQKMKSGEEISVVYYSNSMLSCKDKNVNLVFSIDEPKDNKNVLGKMTESFSKLISKIW